MKSLPEVTETKEGGPSKLLKITLFWTVFIFIIFVGRIIIGSPNSNIDFILKNLLTFLCTIVICGVMLHFLSVRILKLSLPVIWFLTILLISV